MPGAPSGYVPYHSADTWWEYIFVSMGNSGALVANSIWTSLDFTASAFQDFERLCQTRGGASSLEFAQTLTSCGPLPVVAGQAAGRAGAGLKAFIGYSKSGEAENALANWASRISSWFRTGKDRSVLNEELVEILRLRKRMLELAVDAGRGGQPNLVQGAAGLRLERFLGRAIEVGKHKGIDFVDTVPGKLGNISLKGPLPPEGDLAGLAKRVIDDANWMNQATQTVVVDTTGLLESQIKVLKATISGKINAGSKPIIYLEGK